jgi:uncharacterized protein YbjT (DUF2867 family)
MSDLVTIFGGTGFVGRYIVRRLAKAGLRVRVATRDVNEAGFVRPYGAVGQVDPVFANIRDDATVRAAIRGAVAVINCVGTFDARGANNFDAVQAEGATRVARIAAEQGVARFVHLSAIGADPESPSLYGQSKAAGEGGVLSHIPGAVVLRPSVIFGAEDQFFNRFARMATLTPVLPVVGADARFQPVWVDDVAAAAVAGAMGAPGGVYELGGPDVESFRALMERMLAVIQRRRLVLNIPFFAARAIAGAANAGHMISGGLLPLPITPDQVRSLTRDTVVADGARTLADLGMTATPMAQVLPDYLWPYRPSGQYAAIKQSARNLRKT